MSRQTKEMDVAGAHVTFGVLLTVSVLCVEINTGPEHYTTVFTENICLIFVALGLENQVKWGRTSINLSSYERESADFHYNGEWHKLGKTNWWLLLLGLLF
jgi:hypothetical protein